MDLLPKQLGDENVMNCHSGIYLMYSASIKSTSHQLRDISFV